MRPFYRFMLASLFVGVVFIAGAVVTTLLAYLFSFEIGAILTSVAVTGVLFAFCWYVAGEVLR